MTLRDYARRITAEAQARGYSADRYRADDPIVQPFVLLDKQQADLKSQMDKIMAMCWVDRECEVVPYDQGEFAKAQDKIQALMEKVNHNQRVLEELEETVQKLGLTEDRYSIRTLRGERMKAQEMMDFLRMQTDQRLRSKWDAVLEVGGTREMYEKLPEVVAANQKLQADLKPLEEKIAVLDEQIAALDAIVSKFRR